MTSSKLEVLTPANCQIIFIDHQPQMAFGVQSIDRQVLKNNTVALAKAAKVFNIPTIITTVETESFSGNTYPELLDVFPGQDILERTSMNSWDDQKVMLEWQRDWARKETYTAVMDIVREHSGAYGMGVDYAYTMVHKAPSRQKSEHRTLAPVPAR